MNTSSRIILGMLFIIASLLIGFEPIKNFFDGSDASSVPFNMPAYAQVPETAPKRELKQGKPMRIVIPSLSIDIAVTDGYYDSNNQTWTLTKDKAQYAVMTPQANNIAGNTFIYGHNRKEVFAKLSKIKVGEKVTVYTDSGHEFTYSYLSSKETDPTDSSLFSYQGPPILTLQTCSGIFFQNRQLFTFRLSEVV